MIEQVHGRAKLVLEDVARFGHPFLPLSSAPRHTERYSREEKQATLLSQRRLDEMADRLCMPVAYLAAILVNLEDRGLIDWRTGELVGRRTAQIGVEDPST